MPKRRAALPLGLLLIALLLATASQALADGRIPSSGFLLHPRGLAVSAKEGGDVYLSEVSEVERVDQFAPDGTMVRGFGWGVVPGAATGTGNLAAGSTLVTNAVVDSGRFIEGQIVTGPGIPPNTRIATFSMFFGEHELKLTNAASASVTAANLTAGAAPGNVPANERQQLAVDATGGQFELAFRRPRPGTTFPPNSTPPLPYNASHEAVQSALEGLENIGPGNVSVTGGPGDGTGASPYVIAFQGRWADTNVRRLAVTGLGLTGGSPSSSATVTTLTEGGGTMETCTTVCAGATFDEGTFSSGNDPVGSEPGQLNYPDEIAVDNSCAEQEPPLTGSTCEAFDPSNGDVYVVDQRNWRVEKYSAAGKFLLMFGGGVDKGPHHPGNLCTAAYVAEGDTCGTGIPGTSPSYFYKEEPPTLGGGFKSWEREGSNSIAVGPDGTVYIGDYQRVQKFEPNGAYLGQLSLPYRQFVSSLAVNASGDIYALIPGNSEVQSFTYAPHSTFTVSFEGQSTPQLSSGTYSSPLQRELEALSTIGQGNIEVSGGEGEFTLSFRGALAEKNVPQVVVSPETATTLLQGDPHTLGEFSPSAELIRPLDESGRPTHLALDSAGDLFVSDYREPIRPACDSSNGEVPPTCPYDTFLAYHPDGALYAVFSSDQAHFPSRAPAGLAVAADSNSLYSMVPGSYVDIVPIPKSGPPEAKQEEATAIEPTTATLHAVVNPKGYDTHYRFEYGETAAYDHHTLLTDKGQIIQDNLVRAAISGLKPETLYHYRVVAESHCNEAEPAEVCRAEGPDETLETLPPVSYRDFTTQTVSPELVTLKAELNSNGSEASYIISYGIDEAYSGGSSSGTVLLGNEFEEVQATFRNLKPHTTYHYQLMAENEYGKVTTTDRTFTTERSPAEEAAQCPNNNRREEIGSLALPDCRSWEQVTPTFKAGSGVGDGVGGSPFLSPSGERVAFSSPGVFAGAVDVIFNSYLAHRTADGWDTQAVSLRPPERQFQPGFTREMSPELDLWLNHAKEGLTKEEAEEDPHGSAYYLGDASGAFVKATPTLRIIGNETGFFDRLFGASTDFSRLFIVSGRKLLPSDPRPGHESTFQPGDRIYEVSGAGGPEPTLKLLTELPEALPTEAGCEMDGWARSAMNQVSTNGSTLFYDAPLVLVPHAGCDLPGEEYNGPNTYALFALIGEGPPIQISAVRPSQCSYPSPCSTSELQPPEFYGASPDGSLAWFATAEPLVNSDTDATRDLYLAKLQGGQVSELVQATGGDSTDPSQGKGAGLKGVVRVSPEGTAAAFVATGVLTTHENALHQSAAQGADNLYVYDAISGETKFVARLCSGPEKSGSLKDPACPADLAENTNPGAANDSSLWNENGSRSGGRFTPDGRYLVFGSYGRLTSDDTDNTQSVFRYDFQNGQLIRVSFGRNGNDGNGNDDRYSALLINTESLEGSGEFTTEDATRSISASGSIVIFETEAPLVSHDTNEANDLYEWEEVGHGTCTEGEDETGGCVRLVSDGLDRHGVVENTGRISLSGRDITFLTPRSLVPTDTDGLPDIYDARVDGGFPVPHQEPSCESADNCRQAVAPPPNPAVLGSPQFVGSGNSAEHLQCAKGKVRVARHGQVRCVARHREQPNHKKRHHKRRRRPSKTHRGRGGR